MKRSKNLLLTAISATVLTSAAGCARGASNTVPLAQNAPDANVLNVAAPDAGAAAFDEGTPAPRAREVPLPASARSALPRGAETVFCVAATLDNRPVLLHGWNSARGDTTLDILATTTVSRNKGKRRRTTSTSRLKRIAAGRIVPNQVIVRVAPLKAGASSAGARSKTSSSKANARGLATSLEWSEPQVAGAFMTVPMAVVVLPDGVSGAVIRQDFSTESSAGGNTFYTLCTSENGEAFLLLRDESFDARTQNLQRSVWNGRTFERQGESVTRPLETSTEQ